jgi:outer membrane protein
MLGSTRLKRMVVLLCSLLLFPAGCVSDLRREEPPQQGLWPSPISPEPMGEQQPAPGAEPDTEESGPPAPAGPLILSVKESVLLALENNRALSVERLNPSIVQTFEAEERAVFDPSVDAETTVSREKAEQTITGLPVTRTNIIDRFDAVLGVSQFLPTGTEVRGELSTDYLNSDLGSEQQLSRMGLSVTQALLEGRGVSVNLARLRQARLDTRASQYELRAVAEFLVAQVEQTYWDYALARRQIEIFEETLRLAEQQRAETEELINVGRLPESELAAAQAEIALSRQNLINARSRLATTRLQLLRLLNPSGPGLWQREIDIVDKPTQPQADLAEPESHVALALRMRPELNQARLSVLRDELEVVRTRNGLLPVMDLFITLGKTGYADSFGSSVRQIASDDTYDILGGLRFEYPLFNRRDRALHQRAVLGLEQSEEAVANLAQLVTVDVRSALIEAKRTKEQIAATRATRFFREETLRVETEKFRVGRSTNFLVSQARRDLVVSQIAEIEAVIGYLKALVELYRLEGSLLERRGIAAPGDEPVRLSEHR